MALDLSTLTSEQQITAIYIGYYERAADPVGFDFWVDVLENQDFDNNNDGSKLDDIATDFSTQAETVAAHPFFENPTAEAADAFIATLYANLFNREPDAEGLAFWSGALQDAIAGVEGAISVGEIILSVIEGAQDSEAGNDLTTIQNKIAAGLDWTTDVRAVSNLDYENNDAAQASAADVLADVDDTQASVDTAASETDAFVASDPSVPEPSTPGQTIDLQSDTRDNLTGSDGDDTFVAFNGELGDGDRLDGGAGNDVLEYFNAQQGPAVSPITSNIETVTVTNQINDLQSSADNNVGGYSNDDGTIEVDVEIDAGRMTGVTTWDNFDSRADVVIEDADPGADGNPDEITVSMRETDAGNVDYAVYFDNPRPTQLGDTASITIDIQDQEAALNNQVTNPTSPVAELLENPYDTFNIIYNGDTVALDLRGTTGGLDAANASYEAFAAALNEAAANAGVDVTFAVSGTDVRDYAGNNDAFRGTPLTLDVIVGTAGIGDTLTIPARNAVEASEGLPPVNSTLTSITSGVTQNADDPIEVGVLLDFVGRGSMGGDLVIGAMSTGRQGGDDGTSDSSGIQVFDIEVDRSSELQVISSTNNTLEVVEIENTSGSNGDLVVRGVANPGFVVDDTDPANPIIVGNAPSGVATDNPMPGAVAQHNTFGFTDVRQINAATMAGALDLTAVLTEEVVEKYLQIQDSDNDGNADDVVFDYDLGTNNDEFTLHMSADGISSAGTGSREDFNLDIDGNAGDDVITTNIGGSAEDFTAGDAQFGALPIGVPVEGTLKLIDEQGQDYYVLASTNDEAWYENTVFNGAAQFSVDGGAGNDVIWTNGWGNFNITDGAGEDVIYTDNSGTVLLGNLATNIDRNLTEHDQIDYVMGAAWMFNAEGTLAGLATPGNTLTGITNDAITAGTTTATSLNSGDVEITVSFLGAAGAAGTAYTSTATLVHTGANSPLSLTGGNVVISEQALNQAIKDAINNDQVMSQVLEAADGPGNSLAVYSKVDGTFVATDLAVEITGVNVNGTAATPTPLANTAYTTPDFQLFGAASDQESDNVITAAGDGNNDVYVLSTSDVAGTQPTVNTGTLAPTELNGASNETIAFQKGFGTDTVFNFDAGDGSTTTAVAEDVFDFDAFFADNSFAPTAVNTALTAGLPTGTVSVVAETSAIDTLAEVQAAVTAADTNAAASEYVMIVFDAANDNAGTVYSVQNASGVGNAAVTEEGTINLVGTDWTTLTVDNFA